jgi:exonuclease VII small subunit
MKYKGVIQERLNANVNTLELMLNRLKQGVLKPESAVEMLEHAIRRDRKCLEMLDLERESYGFDADQQRDEFTGRG